MLSLIVWLIIILNPLSTIPAYLTMHSDAKAKQLAHDALIIALWVLIILSVAALLWEWLLLLFGLEMEYFRIAGGCVIARVARSMTQWNMSAITMSDEHLNHHKKRSFDRGLIIPLVMPMTAGPGSIAFVISQANGWNIAQLLVAIVACSLVVYLMMRYGARIVTRLGDTGVKLMVRIIGIILLGISLQMIIGTILTLI
jgi:multiple antibiotic resistance protein